MSSLIRVQVFDVAFHVIQLTDVQQRLLGNLALVAHMQVKELASGMCQAAGLSDAIRKTQFVSTEIVANQ